MTKKKSKLISNQIKHQFWCLHSRRATV